MNLKVPGAIYPLAARCCATGRKLLGVVATPFGKLGLKDYVPSLKPILFAPHCFENDKLV